MLIRRLRVFPGISWKFETHCDVYLDVITDLTCHPHYTRIGSGSGRVRGRSVPVHRLDMELAENLTLEPDSFMPEPAQESGRLAQNEQDDNSDRQIRNDSGQVILKS